MSPDDLGAQLRQAGLVGDAVAVAVSSPATGTLAWSTGGGHLPGADGRTPFYLASVTKQLVGVLAAQEVLAGRLDPEDRVVDHLPQLPAWAGAVRVRHLLHHTSGLPPAPWWLGAPGPAAELTNAAVLHALCAWPAPATPPGREHVYNNTGYVVLAEVLAAVTRTALPELARQRVFGPLGLTASRLGDVPAGTPAGAWPPATDGNGGWWATALDLVRWLDALDADLLGAEVGRLVQTPGRLDDGTLLDYAWGVTVRPDAAGPLLTHGGNWPGWTAKTVRQPATRTAVALLSTNDDVQRVSDTGVELHRLLIAADSA